MHKNCSDAATRSNGDCTRISCTLSDFRLSQTVEISVQAALVNRYFTVSIHITSLSVTMAHHINVYMYM